MKMISWQVQKHIRLIKALDSSGAAGYLILTLMSHANYRNRCYPTIDTLATETGYSKRAVIRAMNVLEEIGLIEKVPVNLRVKPEPLDPRRNVYQLKPNFVIDGVEYEFFHYGRGNDADTENDNVSTMVSNGHLSSQELVPNRHLSAELLVPNRHPNIDKKIQQEKDSTQQEKDSTATDKTVTVQAGGETLAPSGEKKPSEKKSPTPPTQYASVAYIEQANKNGLNAQRLYDYVMTPSAPAMPAPLPSSQVKGYKKSEYYLAMQAILRLTTHPDKRDGMLLGAVLGELYKRRMTIKRLLGFLRWYQHTYPNLSYPKVWAKQTGGKGWLDYLADYDTKHPDTSQAHVETSAGDYAPLGVWTGQGEPKVAPWHMAIRNVHGWTNDGEAAVEIVIIARETEGGGE